MVKARAQFLCMFFLLLFISFYSGISYGVPKNVIFMIGDGMGPEQVRAGSFYVSGEPNKLSFQSFPYSGEVTTYSANNTVTDSAAAATALATGQKVNNDVISMAIPGDNSELQTLLEYFKSSGKMTGLVTTTYITHATPAGFGAHETSRNNYDQIGDDYRLQTKPNVLIGAAEHVSKSEFENAGYTVVTNRDQMQSIDPNAVKMLAGQFNSPDSTGYMPYEPYSSDLPHLTEMVVTALDVLDNEPNGFFLMIEGGRIDHASHDNLRDNMVLETVEFSNAVQAVIDWAQDQNDTLILVTADHETGGLKVTQNNGQGVMPSVSWSSVNHTGTNVPVYAQGENSFLISGVMDNTDMFFVCTSTPGEGAWNPTPADGSVIDDTKATLKWYASEDGVSYDIYFGSDYNDVNDANGTFLLNQTEKSYLVGDFGSLYPDDLVSGETYYWRIDEINDVNGIGDPNHIVKGDVWSFTVPPEKAWNPNPADGAEDVDGNTDLKWSTAFGVKEEKPHHVYFGESYDDVLAGTGDTDKGMFAEPTYDPGMLEAEKTYYWRVDETVGIGRGKFIATGDVWSFTVASEVKYLYELDVRVSSGEDDAEEGTGENGYYNESSDLELLDDPDYNGPEKQTVGVHFRNINIPAGATITKAYVEFTCDETVGGTEPVYLLVWGNLSLAPESFGSGTSLITERPSTAAQISWQPESWTSAGQTSQTSDISSIIQELIDQDGWESGNSIEIIVGQNTSSPQFSGVRIAESFDGSASQAPLLHVEYELDAEPEPQTVLDVRVASGEDDAEEGTGTNGYYNESSDLEILDDPSYNGPEKQIVGTHFKNINVPAGATITKAYVEFTCDETAGGTDPAYLLVWGNLSLAPESFGNGTSKMSERTATDSKVSWSADTWTSVGQTIQTADISSIIQELINQDGWAAGMNMEIIIGEDTSMPDFTGVRIAESFDGSASQAPLLHIEFEIKEIPEPVDVRVASGIDDAEEGTGTNGYYNESSDLEILDDPSYNGPEKQIVGAHFKNINVPAGATITKAYVEFTCDETAGGTNPAYLLVWGNLSLAPESFGNGTSKMSERTATDSKVSWSADTWTSVGQTIQTADISSIIQELIDQDGWAAGMNMEIIIGEDTSMPDFTGVRIAESYDGSASQAPLLHIEYEN